jgi:predicted nucleotidyltransferase
MGVMGEELQAIVAELRDHFARLYGPRLVRLVLFGSQARGDAEPGSDIDVLVVLESPVNAAEEAALTLNFRAELSLRYNTVVSCIFMSAQRFEHERSPLLLNVRREGVTV